MPFRERLMTSIRQQVLSISASEKLFIRLIRAAANNIRPDPQAQFNTLTAADRIGNDGHHIADGLWSKKTVRSCRSRDDP